MYSTAEYLVVYDIAEDDERTRVAKLLEGQGTRLQESVFHCRLRTSGLKNLRAKLDALDVGSGFILIYRIDNRAKRLLVGKTPDSLTSEDEQHFVA